MTNILPICLKSFSRFPYFITGKKNLTPDITIKRFVSKHINTLKISYLISSVANFSLQEIIYY